MKNTFAIYCFWVFVFCHSSLVATSQDGDLSGVYLGDDGAHYYLRQVESTVYWFAEDPRGWWSSGFKGKLVKDTLKGMFHHLPKGNKIVYDMMPRPNLYGVNGDLVLLVTVTGLTQMDGDSVNNTCRKWTKQEVLPKPVLPDQTPQFGGRIGRDQDGVWQGQPSGTLYYMRTIGEKVLMFGERWDAATGVFVFSRLFWGKRNPKNKIYNLDGIDLPKSKELASDSVRIKLENGGKFRLLEGTGLPDTVLMLRYRGEPLPFQTTNRGPSLFDNQRAILLSNLLLLLFLISWIGPKKLKLSHILFALLCFSIYSYSGLMNFRQFSRTIESFLDYGTIQLWGDYICSNIIILPFILLALIGVFFFTASHYLFKEFLGISFASSKISVLYFIGLTALVPLNIRTAQKQYDEAVWASCTIANYCIISFCMLLVVARIFLTYKKINVEHRYLRVYRRIYTSLALCIIFVVIGFGATPVLFYKGYDVGSFFYMHTGVLASGLFFYMAVQQRGNMIDAERSDLTIDKLSLDAALLRSQMNPHLIFNTLNSIKTQVQNGNISESVNYINDFSEFLRPIVEHEKEWIIELGQELAFCDLYLKIEAKLEYFRYEVNTENVSEDELSFIKIPAFIFQPFLENAIKHGLRPVEKNRRMLSVEVKKEQERVVCSLTDNGIGRKESQRHQALEISPQKKHVGIQNTQERLDIYYKVSNYNISFEFEDLFDEYGKPMGTKVNFYFPL